LSAKKLVGKPPEKQRPHKDKSNRIPTIPESYSIMKFCLMKNKIMFLYRQYSRPIWKHPFQKPTLMLFKPG